MRKILVFMAGGKLVVSVNVTSHSKGHILNLILSSGLFVWRT